MKDVGRSLRHVLLACSGIMGFFLLAQAAVVFEVVPSDYVPRPTVIVVELVEVLGDGATWSALGQTIQGWLAGMLIAIVAGIPIGTVVGVNRTVFRATNSLIEFLRPVPPVALIPVAILVFGNSSQVVVFLVAFGAFWPLLIQQIYGVRDVDPLSREMARVYGLSRWQEFWRVVVPGALPFTATGLRLAATIGLVLAIAAEFVVGIPGLGYEIQLAYLSDAVPLTYALVIVAGALGLVASVVLRLSERAVLGWAPAYREGKS